MQVIFIKKHLGLFYTEKILDYRGCKFFPGYIYHFFQDINEFSIRKCAGLFYKETFRSFLYYKSPWLPWLQFRPGYVCLFFQDMYVSFSRICVSLDYDSRKFRPGYIYLVCQDMYEFLVRKYAGHFYKESFRSFLYCKSPWLSRLCMCVSARACVYLCGCVGVCGLAITAANFALDIYITFSRISTSFWYGNVQVSFIRKHLGLFCTTKVLGHHGYNFARDMYVSFSGIYMSLFPGHICLFFQDIYVSSSRTYMSLFPGYVCLFFQNLYVSFSRIYMSLFPGSVCLFFRDMYVSFSGICTCFLPANVPVSCMGWHRLVGSIKP